ncbi:STAS domain-containing protein [Mycobacterium angelicum]|nr:STAS domain-containing protein [Mycobacterium angelicum]
MTFSPSTDSSAESPCRYAADCAPARVHVYARSIATVVRVDGEIDASNAEHIAREIRRFARLKTPLILDFSHLKFIAIDGFRALLTVNDEHQRARMYCSVVPGPAMRQLLRIVTDHGLTVADSVPEALQLIDDVIQARRRFVFELTRQGKPPQLEPLTRAAGD